MNYNGSSNNIMIAFKNNKHAKNREMDGFDIVSNPLYLRRFAALLREVTQKGSDLMHLPNGNVIITETKVVTYQYAWNQNKGRFERAKINLRSNKAKKTEEKNQEHTEDVADEYYEETEDEAREGISSTNIDELV